MIFEATGPYNAIGKIAMAQVEAALSAGWRVSVVAKRLHESLQDRVEWLKLYVPSRGFALQWLTARHFIRKALGDPRRFDVIHGHQPQIADLCDVFQCHFLTRAAHERGCLLDSRGWRRWGEAIQKQIVLMAEDRHYHNWNPATHMLFNSDLTRHWFGRYYSMPPSEEVFLCSSPDWHPVTSDERSSARRSFGIEQSGIVIGYLGGLQERKGYRRIISALIGWHDATLLMGGARCDHFDIPELNGRLRTLGLVGDTDRFYAACDAIVLASHFEPFGYVASEAAARGIPVIASEEVGALPHILEHNAGLAWNSGDDLAPLVQTIVAQRSQFAAGCEAYTRAMSRGMHDSRLLQIWEKAIGRRRSVTAIAGVAIPI